MNVRGLVFVGTRTPRADATVRFAQEVLGLVPHHVEGSEAVHFALADGSAFAVQPADEQDRERTVGFLVDDVQAAADELRAAGVEVDDVARAGRLAYVHFRAPDGALYELVERLPEAATSGRPGAAG